MLNLYVLRACSLRLCVKGWSISHVSNSIRAVQQAHGSLLSQFLGTSEEIEKREDSCKADVQHLPCNPLHGQRHAHTMLSSTARRALPHTTSVTWQPSYLRPMSHDSARSSSVPESSGLTIIRGLSTAQAPQSDPGAAAGAGSPAEQVAADAVQGGGSQQPAAAPKQKGPAKTPKNRDTSKKWAISILRGQYSGAWLDFTADLSEVQAWDMIEQMHGPKFEHVLQWRDFASDVATALHLIRKNKTYPAEVYEKELKWLSTRLIKQNLASVPPVLKTTDGNAAETEPVPMTAEGWVKWLKKRGVLYRGRKGEQQEHHKFSLGPRGRTLINVGVIAAAMGLVSTRKVPTPAAKAAGMQWMAERLAGKYEELRGGSQRNYQSSVLGRLTRHYGVQCVVPRRGALTVHEVMGAYFIPAEHDVEARRQPEGAPPLPNSVPGGRLVGTPEEVAEALGLTSVLVSRAMRALVLLLREGYEWPGAGDDDEEAAMKQLQARGLTVSVRPKTDTRTGLTKLDKFGAVIHEAVYRLPTKKQPLLDPHDVAAAWKLKPKKRVLFTDSIPPWVPASLAEGHETRLSESHWA